MSKVRVRSDRELQRRLEDAARVRDCLDRVGLTYWLASGALLGAVRDGDLIRWDWDVEIDVKTEEALPKAEPLLAELKQASFDVQAKCVAGAFQIKARSQGGDRISIMGFDLLDDGEGGLHRRRIRFNTPCDVWDTGFHVTVRGETFQAHTPVEDYLAYVYGDDWRTPIQTANKQVYLSERFRGRRFP